MNARFQATSFRDFGMKARRLLLPIDLAKCPPEIFPFANDLVPPFEGEIVLLNVLDRRTNAIPFRGSGSNFRRAELLLARLAGEFVRPAVEASPRVRIGDPCEEILAEATANDVDLILLPTFIPSIWRRWLGPRCAETARNLITQASCRVLVVDVRTHFNCFRRWPGEEPETRWAA
ncbi:MAG: universal stress protein [Opitutaceae bacterium]|jgi:nucleotide-binding universal stress UspA family protein